MPSLVLIVKFLLLLSAITLQTIIGCEIYHFVASDGAQALEGHVIKTISKPFVNFCWNDCVWLPWCFSINVRNSSAAGPFECELNNSSKKANPNKMVTRQGWSYHEMKGVNPENCKFYDCKRKEDLGDGWRRYGDAAIKLFTEKKNWTEARSHCQLLGGDLLSITSSHENDFVNDVFVENLNLTYMQEDNGIPDRNFKHFKLNGEDPGVKLLGNPGDAVYKVDGREKALYFNGGKGYAQLPPIPFGANYLFSISFWMKVLNHTQTWVTAMNIYNDADARIIEVFITTATTTVYYNVKNSPGKEVPYLGQRLVLNAWNFFTFTWSGPAEQKTRFGFQGKWKKIVNYEITEIKLSANEKWILGAKTPAQLSTGTKAFHGYIKHMVVSYDKVISQKESQTIMHWHEQGVWVGLNDLIANTTQFSWSDGTPVKFKKLQDYDPAPASGRKCVAMAKEKKWLDKHCHLKYPFLCEKSAPP